MAHGREIGARVVSLFCAIAVASLTGACGLSFPIGPMAVDEMPTGSITKQVSPLSPDLDAEDWRRARGALAIALDPVGNGAPASWDNAQTGMKGTFTPLGQAFVKADEICRMFVARVSSASVSGSDRTLRGTACKTSGRDWAIHEIAPAKG